MYRSIQVPYNREHEKSFLDPMFSSSHIYVYEVISQAKNHDEAPRMSAQVMVCTSYALKVNNVIYYIQSIKVNRPSITTLMRHKNNKEE